MKFIFFLIFFVSIIGSVFSFGVKEVNNSKPLPVASPDPINTGEKFNTDMENVIKITGYVQIYGNEPHTFAGIKDENGVEYSIFPPEQEEKLRSLQGNLIEFTVTTLDKPQGYGSLFLKGETVTPLNWKIIR